MKRDEGGRGRKRDAPKWGQHLLTSRDIARSVVKAADVSPADTVLEIGPGGGILTRELFATGARVIGVEKDSSFISSLKEMFAEEIHDSRFTLYEGDIRDVFLPSSDLWSLIPVHSPYKVAANIPYYLTGEIIRLVLTAPHQPRAVSLLVQKEVAERIVKGTKESLLSLSVKAYGEARYVRTVKAGSFNPPPKVDSAILSIKNISRKNFADVSEEEFFGLLHAGFGHRRKTLLGNIRRSERRWGEAGGTFIQSVFEDLGLDLRVRAEDVPLSLWLALTKKIRATLRR